MKKIKAHANIYVGKEYDIFKKLNGQASRNMAGDRE